MTEKGFSMTNTEEEFRAATVRIKNKIADAKERIKSKKAEIKDVESAPVSVLPQAAKTKRILEESNKLRLLEEELVELELDLKDLKRTTKDEKDEKETSVITRVEEDLLDKIDSAAYIIDEGQYVLVKNYSTITKKLNVQMNMYPPIKFLDYIMKELKVNPEHINLNKVKHLFSEKNRVFDKMRYSVQPELWKKRDTYLPLQHLEPYFINNHVVAPSTQAERDETIGWFNCLMHSLSGGKKENQDAIEKWLLHKIINYDKVSTTPDLIVVGHVGGNGKGILEGILRLLLPASLTGKANTKTLNGGFNAIFLGKLIVIFDDQDSREIPLEVVKAMAGSDTLVLELKCRDQTEVEKTHSCAWFSNVLPFKLTPGGKDGGVDRRFSITATNITFLESIAKHSLDSSGCIMPQERCKEVAEAVVKDVLLDRDNIAVWFKYLREKHPEVDRGYTLKPLHGEDYKEFLEAQLTPIEIIWRDLVEPLLSENKIVPLYVVEELLRHFNKDGSRTNTRAIQKDLEMLAKQNRYNVKFDRSPRVSLTFKGVKQYVIQKTYMYVESRSNIIAVRDTSFEWGLVSTVAPRKGLGLGNYIQEGELNFAVDVCYKDSDDNFAEDIIEDDRADVLVAGPVRSQVEVKHPSQIGPELRQLLKNLD